MNSRWLIWIIILLLIIATIQSKYQRKKRDIRKKSNETVMWRVRSIDSLKKACSSRSCRDNPMIRDSQIHKIFPPTFSQLSTDPNVSLESSTSVTFLNNTQNFHQKTLETFEEFKNHSMYDDNLEYVDPSINIRVKRQYDPDFWITHKEENITSLLKMYAFIVRDENIPDCCIPSHRISDSRYFMCSGAILTPMHALTTASCMHFADVYEHHIIGDLGILVGAITPNPYVIKINRYEMHPNYVFQADATENPVHNLAILFLKCSISEHIKLPVLPKGAYDDLGHMCCGQTCDIITVIQKPTNRHELKWMKAKYLPSALHESDENDATPWEIPTVFFSARRNVDNQNGSLIRRVRSSKKLAGVPSFIFPDHSKKTSSDHPKTKRRLPQFFEDMARSASLAKPISEDSENRISEAKLLEQLISSASNGSEVDWDKMENVMGSQISESNKKHIKDFTKELVDETIKRLESATAEIDGKNLSNDDQKAGERNVLLSLLNKMGGNQTIDDFAKVFAKVITNSLPPHFDNQSSIPSELSIKESDIIPPPPKYVDCPPLGSPVIVNEVLVGMVSYTCDDLQNWVEWKYVSISQNAKWIRKRLDSEEEPPPEICESLFANFRSMQSEEVLKKKTNREQKKSQFIKRSDNNNKNLPDASLNDFPMKSYYEQFSKEAFTSVGDIGEIPKKGIPST